jgi:hypothetical protein
MTPTGPYPGQPSQPWSDGGSDEPYKPPADPWGDQPTADAPEAIWGHPTSMRQVADDAATYQGPPTFGASALNTPPPGWGQPPPPPRRRNTPIVALVVVLGLLICGGLGTTAWLLNQRGDDAARGQGAITPAASTAPDGAVVPGPQSSEDARFVKKGQCVRNENTPEKPEMKIVACASGTLEVLKRLDGRTTGEADAEAKCAKVPSYTKWFFYDSELDSLDFVLCLRER